MTIPETASAHPAAPAGSHDLPLTASGTPHEPQISVPGGQAPALQFTPSAVFTTPPVAKRKKSIGAIITIVLLFLALIAAVVFLVMYLLELRDANALIDDQKQKIQEQQEFIDKKETFGAAMEQLLDTADQFEATLFGTIVPTSSYTLTASRAWTHRWDLDKLDEDIESVNESIAELEGLVEAAGLEASSNTTGSLYETTIDSLGSGYVSSLLYDADSYCQSDVLACVNSSEPYIVHFDAADNSVEYTNDFIRSGIAYHEFAHVLQMTNPEPTEIALEAFGGDRETMADCFALTYLDGWKLDHRIYVTSYSWWDVSIGYGYTCDESQRQVVRDWYSQLGYKNAPISQE